MAKGFLKAFELIGADSDRIYGFTGRSLQP